MRLAVIMIDIHNAIVKLIASDNAVVYANTRKPRGRGIHDDCVVGHRCFRGRNFRSVTSQKEY